MNSVAKMSGEKLDPKCLERELERKNNRQVNSDGGWYEKLFKAYIESNVSERGWLYEVYFEWESMHHEFTDDDADNERLAWLDFFRCEFEFLDNMLYRSSVEENRWKYLKIHRGGRPKITNEKESKHYKKMVVKMSEKEYQEFEKAVTDSGARDKKSFILQCASMGETLKAIQQDRMQLLKELAGYKSEFGHIGSNINQIAHFCNASGMASTDAEIAGKLDELTAHLDKIEKLGNKVLKTMGRFVR